MSGFKNNQTKQYSTSSGDVVQSRNHFEHNSEKEKWLSDDDSNDEEKKLFEPVVIATGNREYERGDKRTVNIQPPPPYEDVNKVSRQQTSNVAAICDSPDDVKEHEYTYVAPDATRRDSIEIRSLGTSSTKCYKRACCVVTVVILILVSFAAGGYGVFFFLNKEKDIGAAIVCPHPGANDTASISFRRPSITDFDAEVSICTYTLQTGDVLAIFPFTKSIHTLHNMEEGVNVITATGSDGVKTASCDFTYVRLSVNENSGSAAWSTWGSWDTCTKTCCGGLQSRTRSCLFNEVESNDCIGSDHESQICNTNQCPVWSAWRSWGSCSQTCCGGQQSRTRSCSSCGSPSDECRGGSSRTKGCNTQQCPVLSAWGSWGSCSKTCCGGQQSRKRSCSSCGSPSNDCSGSVNVTQACNTQQCPVLSAWGSWSSCSQTCCGQQSRTRSCSSCGSPSNDCSGRVNVTQACNSQQCPVLSAWGSWGSCSQTCCGGLQSRKRSCSSCGSPSNDCSGSGYFTQACNTQQCQVWSAWGSWGSCSKTCCCGQQSRTRSCSSCGSPSNYCSGSGSVTQACNTQQCPVTAQSSIHRASLLVMFVVLAAGFACCHNQ